MHTTRSIVLAMLAAALMSVPSLTAAASDSAENDEPVAGWRAEYPDLVPWSAASESWPVRAGRPTLLLFTEPGCGFCQALQIGVLSVPEHAELIAAGYNPVRVDGLAGPAAELRARHAVRGVPTMIVLSEDDRMLARLDGWPGVAATLDFLAAHAAPASP